MRGAFLEYSFFANERSRRINRHLPLLILPALALAACGGVKSGQAPDMANSASVGGASPPPQMSQGTAEAENISCTNRMPAADSRNDVLGVTLGMPAQEAYERLACANKAFTVKFDAGGYDLPNIPSEAAPRGIIRADAGTESVTVYLLGMPGQEKVYTIARKLDFGEGAEPPVATMLGNLTAKYGAGTERHLYPGTDSETRIHSVPYSPAGVLLGPENPDFEICAGDPRQSSVSADSRCGLTVDYDIDPKKENPGLAKRLTVMVSDQRGAMQAIEAYRAYAGNAVARQKADELDRANKAVQNAGGDKSRVPGL